MLSKGLSDRYVKIEQEVWKNAPQTGGLSRFAIPDRTVKISILSKDSKKCGIFPRFNKIGMQFAY